MLHTHHIACMGLSSSNNNCDYEKEKNSVYFGCCAAAASTAFRGCYLGPPVVGALIFKLLKKLQAYIPTYTCIHTHIDTTKTNTHTFNLNLTAKYFTQTGREAAHHNNHCRRQSTLVTNQLHESERRLAMFTGSSD